MATHFSYRKSCLIAGAFAFASAILAIQPSVAAGHGNGAGNAPNAADRDTGRDRAEDRMSQQACAQ